MEIGLGSNSSVLVDIGLGLFSVRSKIGSERIKEGLPMCVGVTANCCLLGPTGVPSF